MNIIALNQGLINNFPQILILLTISGLLISSLGFFRVVWFISIGYGYSIPVMAVLTLITASRSGISIPANPVLLLQGIVLLLYGIRLGTFLVLRDLRQSFKGEVKATKELNSRVPLPAKFGIWVTVSILYAAMVSPLVFHAKGILTAAVSGGTTPQAVVSIIGLIIAYGGLLLETLADAQKSAFKKKQPSRFVDTGLYRMVRFPNYFGEMLVWTGSWVTAVTFLNHWSHWLISIAGLVTILLIMMGSAKRLEKKQASRYGEDAQFQTYIKRVPAIFPLIPLYSLQKVKLALDW